MYAEVWPSFTPVTLNITKGIGVNLCYQNVVVSRTFLMLDQHLISVRPCQQTLVWSKGDQGTHTTNCRTIIIMQEK